MQVPVVGKLTSTLVRYSGCMSVRQMEAESELYAGGQQAEPGGQGEGGARGGGHDLLAGRQPAGGGGRARAQVRPAAQVHSVNSASSSVGNQSFKLYFMCPAV